MYTYEALLCIASLSHVPSMPQICGWKLRLKSCSIVHEEVTAPATEGGQLILPQCHLLASYFQTAHQWGRTHLG